MDGKYLVKNNNDLENTSPSHRDAISDSTSRAPNFITYVRPFISKDKHQLAHSSRHSFHHARCVKFRQYQSLAAIVCSARSSRDSAFDWAPDDAPDCGADTAEGPNWSQSAEKVHRWVLAGEIFDVELGHLLEGLGLQHELLLLQIVGSDQHRQVVDVEDVEVLHLVAMPHQLVDGEGLAGVGEAHVSLPHVELLHEHWHLLFLLAFGWPRLIHLAERVVLPVQAAVDLWSFLLFWSDLGLVTCSFRGGVPLKEVYGEVDTILPELEFEGLELGAEAHRLVLYVVLLVAQELAEVIVLVRVR